MLKIVWFRMQFIKFVCMASLLVVAGFAFAEDADQDGMNDAYETYFGLDPASSNDAPQNYDSDTLLNLEESEIFTDPYVADTDTDLFLDGVDLNPLSRSVYRWADLQFTSGDVYSYVRPIWALDGGKIGGAWDSELSCWQAATNETSMLYMDLDRTYLTNRLMMAINYLNDDESLVFIDLLNSNDTVVATNLFGDITSGGSTNVSAVFPLPLDQYPTASRIRLSATAGTVPCRVFTTVLYIDNDGDCLDADQEAQVGTSDEIFDTDTDLLSDYVEVIETGTDPLESDSDGDGLSDGYELNDSRYQLMHDNGNSWATWKVLAEAYGGHLAVVTSEEEHLRIFSALPTAFSEKPWIGLTDKVEKGNWQWVTGETLDYERWASVCPRANWGRYANYVSNGSWVDNPDTKRWARGCLIEYETALDPLNPDCDGDGLTDGYELNTYQTSPYVADSDGDGLSDGDELSYGSDPLSTDSDGDGLSDGYEVMNSRYQLIADSYSWFAACGIATNHGGHLAVITSEEEQTRLVAAVDGDFSSIPWIGLNAATEDGSWAWVNGEALDYICWASSCPRENWGGVYANYNSSGNWVDNYPNSGRGFLIEYETPLDPLDSDSDDDGLSDGDELNLHGTSPYKADSDNDGISDADEVELGVDPLDADSDDDGLTDGEEVNTYGSDPMSSDSDGDGLSDGEEVLTYGTSPTTAHWLDGGMPGMLQAERWNSIAGNHTLYLIGSDAFGGAADASSWVTQTEYVEDAVSYYGARMRGTVTAPENGTYKLWLTADNAAQVWLSESNSPYGRELLLEVDKYTGYQNRSSARAASASVELSAGQVCYVEILMKEAVGSGHATLWWKRPGQTEPEIIGSEYLRSYAQPEDDQDSDGLPDAWETAYGLDPLDATGGGIADADGDTYADIVEYQLGLDPMSVDADSDGLKDGDEATITFTDPASADSDADGTPDLTPLTTISGADYSDYYSAHYYSALSVSSNSAVLSGVLDYVQNSYICYEFNIATAGMYQVTVQASWSNGVPSVATRPLMDLAMDGNDLDRISGDGEGVYTFYTPWLAVGDHEVECTPTWFTELHEAMSIDSVQISAVNGADTDGDGIQDWVAARIDDEADMDGDGITDADEIYVHGSDPLSTDSDGDGLGDADELLLGTDILDADTDGDGVSDGQEVLQIYTDPSAVEFDGSVTVAATVDGASTNAVLGEWTVEGTELVSGSVRGYAEYVVDFPTNDLYRLTINAAHTWSKSSCSPMVPQDTSAFLVYVDDAYVGKVALVSADSVYVDVQAFLPVMPAGEHIVKLYWENVYSRLAVNINELRLESLGGADADGNGTKDWVEVALGSIAGVDEVTESYVSPVCIEGDAKYVEFMELLGLQDAGDTNVPPASSGPRRAAGDRWYANLPLEEDGVTAATARFQNGAIEVPINVEWTPFNLMEHDGETIYVRKDDMVKFVALPAEAVGGQFEIEYTLGMDGETVRSPNTRPLIYLFPSGGTYTVSGEYTHGNETVTASITVVAIDGSFPEESPACLVGKERTWSFEGMPSNIVYEADDTVEVQVAGCEMVAEVEELADGTTVTNQPSLVTEVSLLANDTNGKHVMLVRLYGNGPILASTELQPFWIQNAVDGYFWTVETYEDSELWEVGSVAKNIPDSVDIQIKVIVAGVTLDDYSLERWITNEAYDEIGEYSFRLFHPNDVDNSTCHTFKIYQNGAVIGEAQ